MQIDDMDFEVDGFLNYLTIERGCSVNTIKGYQNDLDLLKEFLVKNVLKGDTSKFDWNKFSIAHLRAFLAYLYNARDNNSSSIHRRVCSIKAFYKYMNDNGLSEKDPAKDLKYPKRPNSIPKFLDVEHILELINASDNLTHKAIIEVLYSTGARVNELRNMNLEDLNLDHNTIMIRAGKGNKDRVVILTDRARDTLIKYLKVRDAMLSKASRRKTLPEDSYKAVFLSNRGTRISNRTIQHFISKLSAAAGIKKTTPHMLRHSFASHLVMNKVNIRAVQQLLGHTSLDTTQIYANITPEYLKEEFRDSLPIR